MILLPILLGVLLVAYLGIVLRTSWVLTHPRRDFVPEGYEPTELPFERVQLRSLGGYGLDGWYARHDEAPGTVVFSHGVWSNYREMESRAEALWRRGFSVLLFDYRACGESEGRTTTLGKKEVDDLLGVLDFLAGEAAGGRIGVWGQFHGRLRGHHGRRALSRPRRGSQRQRLRRARGQHRPRFPRRHGTARLAIPQCHFRPGAGVGRRRFAVGATG